MTTRSAGPAQDWIERVRAASDLIEIVSQTVTLKRSGRNFVGLCPFHPEKTPSFSVHPERQFYHCFSCKTGGDVFSYVMETEKVGFIEAAEMLSRRAGIPIPERRGPGSGPRAPLLEALEAAAAAYEQWLGDPGTGAAAQTLLERRGIGREAQRTFRLGVALPGWDSLLRRLRGRFPEDVLVQAGLVARRDGRSGVYDRFRNRIMVPLIQTGGDCLGFGARAIAAGDEPKYLNSPETPVYHKGTYLFALEHARRHIDSAGEAVVVEGYFDAIALHQAGIRHTVATSGTALTPDHARILRRMTGQVALTFDGDAAGRDAVARSLAVLVAEGLEVAVVDLPPGEDPDTLVRRGGVEAWTQCRAEAADAVEFFERHVLRGRTTGNPREEAVQAVVRLIRRVPDPVRARMLVERAGAVFGLGPAVIERAVELEQRGQGSDQPVRASLGAQRAVERGVEVDVLRALVQNPKSLPEASQLIGPEDFRDPTCARVARWLWDGGAGAPEDAEAAAFARELALAPEGDFRWNDVARGGAARLALRRLHDQRKQTERELGTMGDGPQAAALLGHVSDLVRRIRELEARLK